MFIRVTDIPAVREDTVVLLFTVLLRGYALVYGSTSWLYSCLQLYFSVMLLFTFLLRGYGFVHSSTWLCSFTVLLHG
jgi:hypothetical protein